MKQTLAAKTFRYSPLLSGIATASLAAAAGPVPGSPELPLIYDGTGLVDTYAPDGRLMYCPGVQNIQVYRADRKTTSFYRFYYINSLDDPPGFTYQHHVDIGIWKGLLYAVWDACPEDEHDAPRPLMYSTSADGFAWSEPKLLFPPGTNNAGRFNFYLASNGRMLVLTQSNIFNRKSMMSKKTMLVRELYADHRMGDIYTLFGADRPPNSFYPYPPLYYKSEDAGFVAACREACNNKPLLEQQDLGSYLGDRRMKWHDENSWPQGSVPDVYGWSFGKSFAFYHRKDGTLVGICKIGWVTQSNDEGKTWSLPVVPKGIVAGAGKVWAQKTQDDRYAMIYNPQTPPPDARFPLVVTASDDGITFRNMRVVHGEVPPRRYIGQGKDMGPQYVRGVAEWAGDAPTIDKSAIWVIYSLNKEDIWVSRIPVPIVPEAKELVNDTFDDTPVGPRIPGWNTYSPTWAPVTISRDQTGANKYLKLEDSEPVDYARAIRTFPPRATGDISFRVSAAQTDRGRLEIELLAEQGTRPVRLALNENGRIQELRRKKISSAPGLAGSLFSGKDFTRPEKEISLLHNVDRHWGYHLGGDWSARWSGFIESPYSGEVIFSAETESGMRLKIGDKVVIDGITKGKKRDGFHFGKVIMSEGQKVPIVLEVVTLKGDGKLRLFWEWPAQVHTIIPSSALSHDPSALSKDPGGFSYDQGSTGVNRQPYIADTWLDFRIHVDCAAGRYTLDVNGKTLLKDASFAEPSSAVYALSLRTGEYRGAVVKPTEDLPSTEEPLPVVIYHIDDVKTGNL
ncbi:MAG: PA14 domain-containing protein [Planctomycetota bacterium]|jgi:hypothetical protein